MENQVEVQEQVQTAPKVYPLVNTTILSGKFADKDGQLGNFSGYNAQGQRIFIFKEQMAEAGFVDKKSLKFPIHALMTQREIQTRNEDGELSGVTVIRTQATAVFKSREELVDAMTSDKLTAIYAQKLLVAEANSAGLTKEQVNALLNISI